MKIEIKIDENSTETKIVIVTDKMTDEISELARRLSCEKQREIVGYIDGFFTVLDPKDIVRVYACNGKVYAETSDKEYQLRLRLYEVEEYLVGSRFVRISNSEIVNIKCIKQFDLSLAGTVCVSLCNGKTTYASRRYVTKIKKTLGL